MDMLESQLCWTGWRYAEIVTIREAACLLANAAPQEYLDQDLPQLPAAVQAYSHLIAYAILSGVLPVWRAVEVTREGAYQPIDTNAITPDTLLSLGTKILVRDIVTWCEAKGIRHMWGNTNGSVPFLPFSGYPDELRAAIEAFEAVSRDAAATAKQTPKAALTAWLAEHKPDLSSNARDRVATVANWQPQGGAPKTPG